MSLDDDHYVKLVYRVYEILSKNNDLFSKVISTDRSCILGLKKVITDFPELFPVDTLASSILRLLNLNLGKMPRENFEAWFFQFYEKVILLEMENYSSKKTKDQKMLNEILSLSNLDLLFLRSKIEDVSFDLFLYEFLSLKRLNMIFSAVDLENISMILNTNRASKVKKELPLSLYYDCYKEIRKRLNSWKPSEKDYKEIYYILDNLGQEQLSSMLIEKSMLELAHVMLILKGEYKIKVFNALNERIQKKLLLLVSGEEVVLRDGQILYQFFQEIKRRFYD